MNSHSVSRHTFVRPTRPELTFSSRLQNSFVVQSLTNSLATPLSLQRTGFEYAFKEQNPSASSNKLAGKSFIYAALAGLKPPQPFKMPVLYDEQRPSIPKAEFTVEQESTASTQSKTTSSQTPTKQISASLEPEDTVTYHFELINTYADQIDGFKVNLQSIFGDNKITKEKYEESIQFLLNERGHIASELFLEMQELKTLIKAAEQKDQSLKIQLSTLLDTVVDMQAQVQQMMFWILGDMSTLNMTEEEKNYARKAEYFCNELIEIDKKIDECIINQNPNDINNILADIKEYKTKLADKLQLEMLDLKERLLQTPSNDNLSRILIRMNTIHDQFKNMLPTQTTPSD